MDDTKYQKSFELILHAGNARFHYLSAIQAAKNQEESKIYDSLSEGDREMNEAHECQTDLIRQEVSGNGVDVNILSVHAQDHVTMAAVCKEQAKEFIALYHELDELKKQVQKLREFIKQDV